MYLISDTHGNWNGLERALVKARILDRHGGRVTSEQVVHIGDLANCVEDSVDDDLACLSLVGDAIDLLVVGNHEIPYFDPPNRFGGFHFDQAIHDRLHALNDAGLVVPSVLHNETLISHAGVSLAWVDPELSVSSAQKGHLELWAEKNFLSPIFSAVGRARGGSFPIGGMLWCDFEQEFIPTNFPQVVGHTPRGVRMKGNALCIDVGAKDEDTEPLILRID